MVIFFSLFYHPNVNKFSLLLFLFSCVAEEPPSPPPPPKGSYTIKYVCMYYDDMYPKITSKPCQTGDTDHDCHKIKIEHDIID